MFESIGLTKFLKGALYLNALLAIALATNSLGLIPNIPYGAATSISVISISALVFLLGQTPLFPRLCGLPLMWRLFPNIDGKYDVEISSNWSVIKARTEGRSAEVSADGGVTLFQRTGRMSITSRLTRIDMRLEMDDKYLTSETVVCSLQRERGERLPTLFYVFESFVTVPKSTDSQRHLGAARVCIPLEPRPATLEGHYWTDRNWHNGLNTAGRIRFRRIV